MRDASVCMASCIYHIPQITIHRGRLELFHLHITWAVCEPRNKTAFLPSCKRCVHLQLAETQTRAALLSPHASALRCAPLSTDGWGTTLTGLDLRLSSVTFGMAIFSRPRLTLMPYVCYDAVYPGFLDRHESTS